MKGAAFKGCGNGNFAFLLDPQALVLSRSMMENDPANRHRDQ
jgi:hypothetical protein